MGISINILTRAKTAIASYTHSILFEWNTDFNGICSVSASADHIVYPECFVFQCI